MYVYSTYIPNEISKVIVQKPSIINLATLSCSCSVLHIYVEARPIWNELITATRTRLSGLTAKYRGKLRESCYYLPVGGGNRNKTLSMLNQDANKFQLTCFPCRKEYYSNHDDDMASKVLTFGVIKESNVKRIYKLQDNDIDMLTVAFESVSHRFNTRISTYYLNEAVKKALTLHERMVGLMERSTTIRNRITLSIELQVIDHPFLPSIQQLRKAFTDIGDVKKDQYYKSKDGTSGTFYVLYE